MIVNIENFKEPPFCEKEILRYSGCKKENDEVLSLMHSAISEVRSLLCYRVCWCESSAKIQDNTCDFDFFSTKSSSLAKSIKGADRVILFGATIGVELDRLIAKYSSISPARALMMQAIGTERIEALCDAFCQKHGCNRRFSPGYGDLPLDLQKDLFKILSCEKHIGLYLTESLMMSPSKSVTAFAVPDKTPALKNKCSQCTKNDCQYRGVI